MDELFCLGKSVEMMDNDKSRPVRHSGIRKKSVMNHVTSAQQISQLSLFTEENVPEVGVFTTQPLVLNEARQRLILIQ